MNAQVAAAKRLYIVPSAAGQENGFLDFTSASAKNALERADALVLSAAGRANRATCLRTFSATAATWALTPRKQRIGRQQIKMPPNPSDRVAGRGYDDVGAGGKAPTPAGPSLQPSGKRAAN
jgi:hypothetical protein